MKRMEARTGRAGGQGGVVGRRAVDVVEVGERVVGGGEVRLHVPRLGVAGGNVADDELREDESGNVAGCKRAGKP